ncbi:MAG: FAD-binding protein [Actinobacteria bacterium]|nr:FAD-binding protein [Actinomycetota bacterium]
MQNGSEPARILEHEPGDLTCIVEAGLRLADLQAALAEHGQRVSLDPPGDPTLGECLLEDLSGPLRHRFGTMRDLVIGVTVTLRDGTRASSGGKVVKNVAGYDLGKLFCGSRGRLGAVERVALRLHPQPVAQRTLTIPASDWSNLHHSGLTPSAVDIVGDRMHVLFEGGAGAVRAQVEELGGDETDPWSGVRALQAGLQRRVRWDGEPAQLVRPGARVAYLPGEPDTTWSPLAERIVEAMCSPS